MIVKSKNETLYNVLAVIPYNDYESARRFVMCLGRNEMGFQKYIIPANDIIGVVENAEENGDIWNYYFKGGNNGKEGN